MQLDKFLIDKADTLMTRLQRRGLHLLRLKVWWSFAILMVALAQVLICWPSGTARALWLVITGLVFGAGVFFRVQQFKDNMNYPEEHRVMQRLNSLVLLQRDRIMFRTVMIIIWSSIVLGDVLAGLAGVAYGLKEITFFVLGLLLCSDMYLECCMFIGPGEHSRDRKEVFATDVRESRL